MLNKRKPYEIDLDAVMRAAREHGKMMELNAHPPRLDLDDVACAAAKNYGVPIVISTDAHRINGLAAMRYGVLQARRGGLTKQDVANTRTWPQLKKLLGRAGHEREENWTTTASPRAVIRRLAAEHHLGSRPAGDRGHRRPP